MMFNQKDQKERNDFFSFETLEVSTD